MTHRFLADAEFKQALEKLEEQRRDLDASRLNAIAVRRNICTAITAANLLPNNQEWLRITVVITANIEPVSLWGTVLLKALCHVCGNDFSIGTCLVTFRSSGVGIAGSSLL